MIGADIFGSTDRNYGAGLGAAVEAVRKTVQALCEALNVCLLSCYDGSNLCYPREQQDDDEAREVEHFY